MKAARLKPLMKKEFSVSALKMKRSASRLMAGVKSGTERLTIHAKSESVLTCFEAYLSLNALGLDESNATCTNFAPRNTAFTALHSY